MKPITTKYFPLFILLLVFSSCKKDNGVSPAEPTINQLNDANVSPFFTSSLTGSGNFTFSASDYSAYRSSSDITIYGQETSTGAYFFITIPLSAYNGANYSTTSSSCTASIEFMNSSGVSYYSNCGPYNCYSCTIRISIITSSRIKGSFDGRVVRTSCTGSGYDINSGSFDVIFQ